MFFIIKIVTSDKLGKEDVTHLELNLQQFNELYNEIEKIKNLVDFIQWNLTKIYQLVYIFIQNKIM